jgi:hypothetical protein
MTRRIVLLNLKMWSALMRKYLDADEASNWMLKYIYPEVLLCAGALPAQVG